MVVKWWYLLDVEAHRHAGLAAAAAGDGAGCWGIRDCQARAKMEAVASLLLDLILYFCSLPPLVLCLEPRLVLPQYDQPTRHLGNPYYGECGPFRP